MVDVFIGIGSNIEPQRNIPEALVLLKSNYPSIIFSRIFESEAIGLKGDNFWNLVGKFDSGDFQPNDESDPIKRVLELTNALKSLENELGRSRNDKRFSARNIDIDILLFGNLQINSPIELPRGEILENAYVLWPLAELEPDLKYPGSDKSYREYWREFDKSLQKLEHIE